MTSLVTPRLVGDVVIATGEMIVRKQQIVLGGYDADYYVTGRLWVTASDGVRVPVSVVARADLVEVGADGELRARAPSPFVLYGYGSYEISIDPSFSSLRLSLLERGVIFAIAHVRGGGEMGRSWYEIGETGPEADHLQRLRHRRARPDRPAAGRRARNSPSAAARPVDS